MAQKYIPLEAEQMYHVWTHANGNDLLFRSEENYRFFMDKYLIHAYPVVETFAYCLMPNHLHLMVRVRSEKQVVKFLKVKRKDDKLISIEDLGGIGKVISQQFSNLFNAYTKSYNNKYNRIGSLFAPNFRRKKVESDVYYSRLIAYIHNNPIHHGFVSHPSEWNFSSWYAYSSDRKTNISRIEGLSWFGKKEVFEAMHANLNMENLIHLFE